MGIYTIVVSILIVFAIPIFEVFRKKEKVIDYLSLINLLFIIVYGISPLYLYFFEGYTTWATIKHSDIHGTSFFLGELLALLFYVLTALSYYFSDRLKIVQRAKDSSEKIYSTVSNKQFVKVALILFIIGGGSLLVYMQSLGGYSEFIRLGPILRNDGGFIQNKFAFLDRLTPLLTVASFMFYAFIKNSKGFNRFIYFSLFAVSTFGAVLSVFHSSGRLNTFMYLMTFPLAHIVYKNKIKLRTVVIGVFLFLFIVLFGNNLLNINKETDFTLDHESYIELAGEVIQEFSFPYTNLGNALMLFPSEYNFRGGIMDIVVAPLNYIPSRLVNFDFMDRMSASQFNTTIYNTRGQIPVDIVTFGYMSFGIAGVMLLAILFGFMAKLFESLFSNNKSMIASMFFVCIMTLLAFRIMYGDPHQFVYTSFRYVATFILLIMFVRKPKEKTRRKLVW